MESRYILVIFGTPSTVTFGASRAEVVAAVPQDTKSGIEKATRAHPDHHIAGSWGRIMPDNKQSRALVVELLQEQALEDPGSVAILLPTHRLQNSRQTTAQAKRDRRAAKLTAQFATT
jgi:hypothetical protein